MSLTVFDVLVSSIIVCLMSAYMYALFSPKLFPIVA